MTHAVVGAKQTTSKMTARIMLLIRLLVRLFRLTSPIRNNQPIRLLSSSSLFASMPIDCVEAIKHIFEYDGQRIWS
jgi:hypothetical protein